MNEIVKQVTYYSRRGQELILVLQALWTLGGRNSKQETISFIRASGWFDITRHDLPAYVGCGEPKYHTLLAWARKDGTISEWIFDDERDSWGITRTGRDVLDGARAKFNAHKWSVSECFLWTPRFKKLFDPSYEPSSRDKKHPEVEREEFFKKLGIDFD
jgi:hypothetical protein